MEEIIPYFSLFSVGFGLYVWWSRRSDENKRQRYVKKTINNNVRELIKITSTINSKSMDMHDSDEKAMMLELYFTRHVRRLELLRLNIENNLTQLPDEDNYTTGVAQIIEIESWLVEKFDDPAVLKNSRSHMWKKYGENNELENKTRNLIDIATKLKIRRPITIS